MYSEIIGSKGIPVLILHGWGHTLEDMRPLGDILSSFCIVHLVDLPGFGRSEVPSTPWGTREYAEVLLGYMDENKLGQAVILGHSFGGRIAIRLAADFSERVLGLVLINSAGLKRTLPWRKRCRSLAIGALRRLVRIADGIFRQNWYGRYFIPAFASADFKSAGSMKATFVKLVNEDLSPEASRIKAPAFLLWGEDDSETPLRVGQRLHELIAGSSLRVLPRAGHNMHLNAGANLCAFHIRPFLSKLAVDGGLNA